MGELLTALKIAELCELHASKNLKEKAIDFKNTINTTATTFNLTKLSSDGHPHQKEIQKIAGETTKLLTELSSHASKMYLLATTFEHLYKEFVQKAYQDDEK